MFKFWSVIKGIAKFSNRGMTVIMLDEHLGFWSFPIFLSIALGREQSFRS